jgi:beta-glucosidase
VSTGHRIEFPEGFLWGVSTSAYQVEGVGSPDARGTSIWDVFSAEEGRVYHGDTAALACDHHRLVDVDLDLMARLGVGGYRFSVSWTRVQPDGKGPANQAGLDFYRRLVDGLHQRGIVPMLTIYHWDLPQQLEREGGWVARATADRFVEYADILARALGDRVNLWVTFNEPWCSSFVGYGTAQHAPGRADLGAGVAAAHHLLLAHGRATQSLRAALGQRAAIGIALNLTTIRPATDDEADVEAARRADGNLNRFFLDPLFRGTYPDDVVADYETWKPGLDVVADGDLQDIATPTDFLGVNYYSPRTVAARPPHKGARTFPKGILEAPTQLEPLAEGLELLDLVRQGLERTTMGWEIEPDGLREVLGRVARDYARIPLYVTENGASFSDYTTPEGQVVDPERIRYLDGHIRAVHDSISRDVDVRGYFVRSLFDNFEWAHGYSKRFGLVYVDYPTATRVPKDSFSWYQGVISANGLNRTS